MDPIEDLLADLDSQSIGLTSLLNECFNDGDTYDDATSAQTQHYRHTSPCAPQECPSGLGMHVGHTATPSHHSSCVSAEAGVAAEQASPHPHLKAAAIHGKAESGAGPCTQAPAFSIGAAPAATARASCGDFSTRVGRRRGRVSAPRLPDLQQELRRLTEKFQQLGQENVVLKNKLKVLERVVPHRDESAGYIAQLLCAAAQTPTTSSHDHAANTAQADGTSDAAGPLASWPDAVGRRGSTAQEGSTATSGHAAAATSGGANRPGEQGVDPTTSYPAWRSSSLNCGTGEAFRGASCGGDLNSGPADTAPHACPGSFAAPSLSAGPGAQPSGRHPHGAPAAVALCPGPDGEVPELTPAAVEELKRITPQDFRQLWKHICLQMGVLVTSAEVHGPGSPPHVRLERFLERALAYVDKLTLMSPACFVQSMYTNVDTGQPERPSDTFWMKCAQSLQLTPQQLADVTALAAVYEQDVLPVVQQRLLLATRLSSSLASADAQLPKSGEALTALSAVDELAQQLERSVLREHRSHWAIGDFLCSSVLTPLQVAKALTVAYPYIPDGVAMMHAFKQLSGAAAGSSGGQAAAQAAGQPGHAAHGPGPRQQPGGGGGAGGGNGMSQLPNLTALLASQLPALAGLLASASGQPASGPGVAAVHGAGAGRPAVAGAAGGQSGPQPALPAAPPAGLQPAQVQALLSRLQAASVLAKVGAQVQGKPAVQAGPGGHAAPQGQLAAPAAAAAQLQAIAALLAAGRRANAAAGVAAGVGSMGAP